MTAKETLNEIRKMGLEIDALADQIIVLRQEAEGIKAMELSDMPKGGKARDSADIIAEVVDLQQRRFELQLSHIKKREKAMCTIAFIDNSEYRTLLMLRYILCKSWDNIVDEMKCSYATVFRLHGAALQSFDQKTKDERK